MIRRTCGLEDSAISRHFGEIYWNNLFGGKESRSGTGSSLEQTARLRQELPTLLKELGVKRLADAPCGDCHWISQLRWTECRYVGIDIVPALIEQNKARFRNREMQFRLADLCEDSLPPADIILCRDCWVHLSYQQIKLCLSNFRRSEATYLLTTTFPSRGGNRDLNGDIWRTLDLEAPPFSFPKPIKVLIEGCTEDEGAFAEKSLALWRLKDLAF
jgi:hypothetical protein